MTPDELKEYRSVCGQNVSLRREIAELRTLYGLARHETGRSGFIVHLADVDDSGKRYFIVTGPTGLEHKYAEALARGIVNAGRRLVAARKNGAK